MKFHVLISLPGRRRDKLLIAVVISLLLHLMLPSVMYWGQRYAPLPTPPMTQRPKMKTTRMRPAEGELDDMVMFDFSPHLPPSKPSHGENTPRVMQPTKQKVSPAHKKDVPQKTRTQPRPSPPPAPQTTMDSRRGTKQTPHVMPTSPSQHQSSTPHTQRLSAEELHKRALAHLLKPRPETKASSHQKQTHHTMIPKGIKGTGKIPYRPVAKLGCSVIDGHVGKDLAFREGEAGQPSLEELKWVSYLRSIARELAAGVTKHVRYASLPLAQPFGILMVNDRDGNMLSYQFSQTGPAHVNTVLLEWIKFVLPLPPVPHHLHDKCTYIIIKTTVNATGPGHLMMYFELAHGTRTLPT